MQGSSLELISGECVLHLNQPGVTKTLEPLCWLVPDQDHSHRWKLSDMLLKTQTFLHMVQVTRLSVPKACIYLSPVQVHRGQIYLTHQFHPLPVHSERVRATCGHQGEVNEIGTSGDCGWYECGIWGVFGGGKEERAEPKLLETVWESEGVYQSANNDAL